MRVSAAMLGTEGADSRQEDKGHLGESHWGRVIGHWSSRQSSVVSRQSSVVGRPVVSRRP